MRKDFLELVEYSVKQNMGVIINTNGWFIDANMAQLLKQLGVFHVRVSIDGATAKTHDAIRGVAGSFHRAIDAVKHLKNAEIPFVGISPTIMQENVLETGALIDLASYLGVSEIQLVQMADSGRANEKSLITADHVLMLREVVKEKKSLYPQMKISASETVSDDKPFKKNVQAG